MKKILVIAGVVALMVASVAANAFVISVNVTPNGGATPMITTISDAAPTPYSNAAGNQTWFLLPTNQAWVSGDPGALNSKMNSTAAATDGRLWTFAVFVDSAVANPTMTVKFYGANASYLSDVVGKTWELKNKATGEVLASTKWTSTMINAANAGLTYTFNTSNLEGAANAMSVTLGEATVPEPGSMIALLSGLAGLGGLVIRRRK